MLVEALANAKDSAALPVAVGVTVFLNTVLYRAVEFEERVLLRGEMIEGGMLQAVADARSTFGTTMVRRRVSWDGGGKERCQAVWGVKQCGLYPHLAPVHGT